MAQFEKWFTQDLTQNIELRHCESIVFTNDNLSNVVGVNLFVNGVEYSGGGTVTASVVRSDGATVALSGTLDGNKASVTLTSGCFGVPGLIGVYIRLNDGDTKTTVLSAVFTVIQSETESAVDPGTIIPSVQVLIDEIEDAVNSIPADYSQLLASIAPTFSTITAYAAGVYVWQEGVLYRFTAAHPAGSWTGTDATAVVVGNELSNAVRYDTAQSLTDTQKTTARGNIAAASLIPDGTAFSKAVQGGTTYDVQDARVAPLDERVNALHNLVNYGYDIRGYTNGILKSRIGTTVVIDGHTSGTVPTKVLLSGAPYVHLGGAWPSELTTGITLTVGRKYRLHCTEISGTRGGTVVPRFYPAGTFSFPSGQINTETDSIITYNTTDYPNGVFAALAVQAGKDYSDYTVQLIVEDITEAGDANIAPIDTPTATNTHQPGDLLTVSGQLYKATQAIAPGAVITPGTNVSPTTVAAQLAALEARIAALEG